MEKKVTTRCSFLPCSFSFSDRAAVPRTGDGKLGIAMRAREEGY